MSQVEPTSLNPTEQPITNENQRIKKNLKESDQTITSFKSNIQKNYTDYWSSNLRKEWGESVKQLTPKDWNELQQEMSHIFGLLIEGDSRTTYEMFHLAPDEVAIKFLDAENFDRFNEWLEKATHNLNIQDIKKIVSWFLNDAKINEKSKNQIESILQYLNLAEKFLNDKLASRIKKQKPIKEYQKQLEEIQTLTSNFKKQFNIRE